MNGATFDTARTLSQTESSGRVISQNGVVEWPPRCYDLTPIRFFYGAIWRKEFMLTNKPATISNLKGNINCWNRTEFMRNVI